MGSLAGDKDHRVFIDSASGVGAPPLCFMQTTFFLRIRKITLVQMMSTRDCLFPARRDGIRLHRCHVAEVRRSVQPCNQALCSRWDSPLAVNPLNLEGANLAISAIRLIMFAGAAFTLPSAIVRRTPCPAGSLRLPGSLQPATMRS